MPQSLTALTKSTITVVYAPIRLFAIDEEFFGKGAIDVTKRQVLTACDTRDVRDVDFHKGSYARA